MGSLGSLMALWLGQQGSMPLFLLGRSGRAGSDASPSPQAFGVTLLTMARSDVGVSEEAADIMHAAGHTSRSILQVRALVVSADRFIILGKTESDLSHTTHESQC